MRFVQFRVHPGIGCARMGNSDKAYHLASEFPYFLQEEFPNLRFKPKPRVHPKKFFPNDVVSSATGVLATHQIYDTTPAFQNKFKEDKGKIFPQAARFRVFAYVYDDMDQEMRLPHGVFEVTADLADITWKVNIANKKSQKETAVDPHENLTNTSSDLDTADTSLICKRLRPVPGLPNLAYIFLERDDADKSKVTGRLHVIGNEGEFVGTEAPSSLWSDDWYDSAGDGFVKAMVKPIGDGAALWLAAGASSIADLKYLGYGTKDPQAGSAESITAMPGWVVVGCPDYVPDMGHFVSLWDLALARGFHNLETPKVAKQLAKQPEKHKLIPNKDQLEKYKATDYLIHIHPQLCLFDDVKYVSGEAFGDPENRPPPPEGRAHNIHPDTHSGGPPPAATEGAAIKHGGVVINARANKADLGKRALLKDRDSTKPIGAWLKRAVFKRLRTPGTLYDKKRKFLIKLAGELGNGTPDKHEFPRKLGRRMDYDPTPGGAFGPNKNKFYEFPGSAEHDGNLLKFHGLADKGNLCGGRKSPVTANRLGSSLTTDLGLINLIDDMYWPATFADMPLLRELAYTPHQYAQFHGWQAFGTDVRSSYIFDEVVAPALKVIFAQADDADKHFSYFLVARPLYAPAMIDMAHLGAMLGGSFLPGIEVGREAGIAKNWCLFHGATKYFPSIRFEPCTKGEDHKLGTLTKDLAVPWTEDFKACDESFWPTSRPGRTTKDGTPTRHNWQITRGDTIPHLPLTDPAAGTGAVAASAVEFVKEYWKALGFIRRDDTDKFIEQEQSWH